MICFFCHVSKQSYVTKQYCVNKHLKELHLNHETSFFKILWLDFVSGLRHVSVFFSQHRKFFSMEERKEDPIKPLNLFTLHNVLYFIQKDPLEIQNSTSHLITFHTAQGVLTFVLMQGAVI